MSQLTSDELFHLGLHSLESDDVEKSLDLFKRCVESDPNHAKATYMIGALYAQIQMVDSAAEWMQRAIDMDAGEKTAVFQLGLLYLTSGEVEKARSTWEGLSGLPEDHAFRLFSQGMLALVEDDFEGCIKHLEMGIARNDFNAPLNNDMSRVIESAAAALESQAAGANLEPAEAPATRAGTHIALSGYRQSLKKH
ncbi:MULTISPECIES: lipopolysaccharide assembly protein LapB [Microbulbifer]|uniref:tetratricopeptide repeat protein n=1 Tax=Microbulbifer TaxID=48073 RepID=UPI001E2D8F22|nr:MULTISPECIES: tetratricopeptide repeat protein [Microbulbifer]UHQ56912.1 hypothetical protein LVE68_08025 [Microbulbifer sp. YPW16]